MHSHTEHAQPPPHADRPTSTRARSTSNHKLVTTNAIAQLLRPPRRTGPHTIQGLLPLLPSLASVDMEGLISTIEPRMLAIVGSFSNVIRAAICFL